MEQQNRPDLTQLLGDVNAGREGAYNALAGAVQARLKAMAEQRLARKFGRNLPGRTIQPTALADDTFMKLLKQRQKYDNAGHFFAIASLAMRRLLLDYIRGLKGHPVMITLPADCPAPRDASDVQLEVFDEALEKLAQLDERKAHVVKYRVYWGLTVPEVAEALAVSRATAERDWAFSKAWLSEELSGPDS